MMARNEEVLVYGMTARNKQGDTLVTEMAYPVEIIQQKCALNPAAWEAYIRAQIKQDVVSVASQDFTLADITENQPAIKCTGRFERPTRGLATS